MEQVALSRAVLIRDGTFFLGAEILLIFFLSDTALKWWMGFILMLVYVAYAVILMQGVGVEDDDDDDGDDGEGDTEDGAKEVDGGDGEKEDLELSDRVQGGENRTVQNPMSDVVGGADAAGAADDGGDDGDDDEPASFPVACITFDTNALIFGGKAYTPSSAWVNLTASTMVIAVACYLLAEAVILSARGLGIAPYFTAVILGAAASSVPDTIISYKDALKGDYDDAVANAIGSNIFDICFALGFPLFLYGLIEGDVTITPASATAAVGDTSEIQVRALLLSGLLLELTKVGSVAPSQSLRVMLVICSIIMLGFFLITPTGEDSKGRPVRAAVIRPTRPAAHPVLPVLWQVHYVGKLQATGLMLLYVVWTTIIVLQAADILHF